MPFPRVVRFPGPLDKGNDCSGDEIDEEGKGGGGEHYQKKNKHPKRCHESWLVKLREKIW